MLSPGALSSQQKTHSLHDLSILSDGVFLVELQMKKRKKKKIKYHNFWKKSQSNLAAEKQYFIEMGYFESRLFISKENSACSE